MNEYNDINNLVIENYPILNGLFISTEFDINPELEISISINNSNILDKSDIVNIQKNIIELSKDIKINKNDSIVIIYNRNI
jgi:hypothetical protein